MQEVRAHPESLATMQTHTLKSLIREDWFLAASAGSALCFVLFGNVLFEGLSNPFWLAAIFLWLFAAVLGSALAVVRHAEHLAARLGEPYGTLILTLSVTAIEAVSISAMMLHGADNPTLTRDTLLAVLMIILNGMVGVSLLIGGWRHHEQYYNLQGANAYLSVIIPLTVLSLVLPNFTETTAGPTLSRPQELFLILMSAGLYCAFLAIQSGRHRGYFMSDEEGDVHDDATASHSILLHVIMLMAYMAPVIYLAEQLASPVAYAIRVLDAPAALGGVAIAALVATPEAIGAARAAVANRLQRSVNIFLGSVLSTIGLTIPIMLLVSNVLGQNIVLGVDHANLVLLLLTLFVSTITFSSARTNVLQGLVHVLLFFAYIMLTFEH
jgi:Ca2+:H+ antiporter